MTKAWMATLACMGVFYGASLAWPDETREPRPFVLGKLEGNDLVFMGTTHRQPVILSFLEALLPSLRDHGVTHLALEIASDQQANLDGYLNGDNRLAAVKLHAAIECPGYRNLLKRLHSLPAGSRPVVKAIDLPPALYRLDLNRDQWMASRLIDILRPADNTKVLVVLGSTHILRTLPWQTRVAAGHPSIRATLQQNLPRLKIASIMNIVGSLEKECDFARAYGDGGAGMALDLDHRFGGWKLGPVQCMALKPMPAHELVEGIILH